MFRDFVDGFVAGFSPEKRVSTTQGGEGSGGCLPSVTLVTLLDIPMDDLLLLKDPESTLGIKTTTRGTTACI